ncbi:MAG: hypothetical protein IPH20_00905 [Bacteroidales bacterium]|nr:hypothetical protein [Bacteroidales bacterium]
MKLINYLILFLIITGCSHRIIRTGYQMDKSDYRECDIAIQKFIPVTDSMKKVGEIKLGETGFSVSCSEAHAIEILRNEGCALDANLVIITEETRPDLMSSCYRCKAEFYQLKGKSDIQTDRQYEPENIQARVSHDRGKNGAILIGSIAAGVLVGLLLFH